LRAADSGAVLQRKSGVYRFRWLRELTMTVTPGLPEQIRGGLVFAGSDAQPPAALGLEGKILVRLGAPGCDMKGSLGRVGDLASFCQCTNCSDVSEIGRRRLVTKCTLRWAVCPDLSRYPWVHLGRQIASERATRCLYGG